MGPDQRRSKESSFMCPLAPDPQPRWELSHIRMAAEMGPGEAGDKPLIYIPDTSTVGIFTHICTGLGISLIPGTLGIPHSIQTPAIRYLVYPNVRVCGTTCNAHNAIVANYWLATIRKNVHEAPVSTAVTVTGYRVIHDIIPTRTRQRKIRLTPTDLCDHCNRLDSLQHRLTECGAGPLMWEGTRKIMARMLSIDWKRLPSEWLLRPTITLWPPQKQSCAVVACYICHMSPATTQGFEVKWLL